jgi:aminopeptidase N
MKGLLILFSVLLTSALLISSTEINSRDGQDLRLPRTILPRLYEITLLPILIEGNFTTEGSTTILIDCITNTNTITLHIADIQFSPAGISVSDYSCLIHFLI